MTTSMMASCSSEIEKFDYVLDFKFDSSHVTSKATRNQVDFLKDVIRVAEYFINSKMTKTVIELRFKVDKDLFSENLRKVSVEFADWSKWKQKKEKILALSWIDKNQIYRVFLNKTFWERYEETKDEEEKKKINFMLSLCVLHEIGHLLVQWSTDKEFERVKKRRKGREYSFAVTPDHMDNEAGRYFERSVFSREVKMIVTEDNPLNWSKTSQIIAIALEISSTEFSEIFPEFIAKVLDRSIPLDDVTNFKRKKPKKLEPGTVALKPGCEKKKRKADEQAQSTPIKAGTCSVPLCGTHFLVVNSEDPEETDDSDN